MSPKLDHEARRSALSVADTVIIELVAGALSSAPLLPALTTSNPPLLLGAPRPTTYVVRPPEGVKQSGQAKFA